MLYLMTYLNVPTVDQCHTGYSEQMDDSLWDHPSTWSINVCDPTSIACDEVLEKRGCGPDSHCFLCGASSQTSFQSDSPMDSQHSGQLKKPRSRSEDCRRSRARYFRDVMMCSCSPKSVGSPRRLAGHHSYTQSSSVGPSSPGIPTSVKEGGHDQDGALLEKPQPNHSNDCFTSQTVLPNGENPVSQDISPTVPPPMGFINMDRFNWPGYMRRRVSSMLDDGPTEPDPISTSPSCQIPTLIIRPSPDYLCTSETGSCSDIVTGSNSGPSPNVDDPWQVPRLRVCTTASRMLDASARDSGLSSHSSNSAVGTLSNSDDFRPDSVPPALPPIPPVPPHAPNSRTALASVGTTTVMTKAQITSDNVSKSSNSTADTATRGRVQGLTIRLGNFTIDSRTPMDHPPDDSPRLADLCRSGSGSPIWKRNSYPMNLILSSVTDKPSPSRECGTKPKLQINPLPNASSFTTTAATTSLLPPPPTETGKQSRCEQCMLSNRHFLSVESTGSCGWTPSLSMDPKRCALCHSLIEHVGVNLFNRHPIEGLRFLERHKWLTLNDPASVALFLQSTSGLCRSRVGAFLGLPSTDQISPKEVMRFLFERLDFNSLDVDEVLRLVIHNFGMPVESQEIDRFLDCLASCYHTFRWPERAPVTRDQMLLLFYAVLLLQTSLHNQNAARSTLGKQTAHSFVRNVQDFLFNDLPLTENTVEEEEDMQWRRIAFSPSKLTAIYQRIKNEPLVLGPDHTALINRISQSITPPDLIRAKLKRVYCSYLTSLRAQLVQPHRRLVFYCVMIQFNTRPDSDHRRITDLLRHVFLFNDMLLLARHPVQRGRTHSSGNRLSRKQPPQQEQRLHQELTKLLRGKCDLKPDGLAHGLAVNLFQTQTRSPNSGRRLSGQLTGVRGISLLNCVIQPFRTNDCRYGMEIWRTSSSTDTSPPQLAVCLAALTRSDYANILSDLLQCLREVHCVEHEHQSVIT